MRYLRRVLGVTLRNKEHSLKSVKPAMSSHFPNREIQTMLVRPCVQNVPGKIG